MAVVKTQHAIGALVGSAVGDALGAPFEFEPPGLYQKTYPVPVLTGIGEMRGGGRFGWKPAEFTDDTQMAVALAHESHAAVAKKVVDSNGGRSAGNGSVMRRPVSGGSRCYRRGGSQTPAYPTARSGRVWRKPYGRCGMRRRSRMRS